MRIIISCCFALALSVSAEVVPVFRGGDGGIAEFRIPSLVTTKKGTLLALVDARVDRPGDIPNHVDLAMRRSEDGGKTWKPLTIVADYDKPDGAADAAMMVDRDSGRIWILYTVGLNAGIRQSQPGLTGRTCLIHAIHSGDDGVTWSEAMDLSPMIKSPKMKFIGTAPGRGLQLRDGTYVFPVYVTATDSGMRAQLIYSQDRGKTWKISNPWGNPKGSPATTETQCVQLADGSIMVNSRNHYKKGCRAVAISKDLGQTWSEMTFDEELHCPTCMASLISVPDPRHDGKELLVFANPASKSSRRNGMVRLSDDEGKTWKWRYSVAGGKDPYGYSCLTQLLDGDLGLLYEHGNRTISFQRIDLEALLAKPYAAK